MITTSIHLKQKNMKKWFIITIGIVLAAAGLILLFCGYHVASAGDFSAGYFSAGRFSAGIFSAGLFSIGIFSAGVFSVGIFSIGIFNAGLFCLGFFIWGWRKRYAKVRLSEESGNGDPETPSAPR